MRITKIQGNRYRTQYKILRWDITPQCNYKCDYCIKDVFYKRKLSANVDDCLRWINSNLVYSPSSVSTRQILSADNTIIVQLFGGEPTLHPQFWHICSSLRVPFGIYTNLSQEMDFYKKLFELPYFVYFICSLHFSQEKDIKVFYQKLKALLRYDVFFNVAVFLENQKMSEIEKSFLVIRDIVSDKGTVYFNNETTNREYYKGIDLSYYNKYMLHEQKITITYSDGETEILTELDATSLLFEGKLNLKNFVCDCNRYGNFVLDTDGQLYSCVCGSPISSIYSDKCIFKYPKVLCNSPQCHPYLLEYGTKVEL